MKRTVVASIVVVGALVIAGVVSGLVPMPGVSAVTGKAGKPPVAAGIRPRVTVVRITPSEFVETVLVTGSLVAREEILVGPEIDGLRVLAVLADEGDRVRKGQVLARLVSASLDAQLAQKAAALAKADAAIAQAKSQIEQAEATLQEAKRAFARAKPLQKRGFLAESTFDARRAAERRAVAAVRTANDGLRFAHADKALIAAQRRELLWRMGNTDVKSPADGIVSRRTARVGAMAMGAGEPMFRLIARGLVELDAEVTEVNMGKIAKGQRAAVLVAGVGRVVGRVRLVSPEVDRATRLGHVRILLGDDIRFRIGSFARGTIETANSQGLALPVSAVLYGPNGAFVQVVKNDKVERRRVETGLISGTLIQIRGGLQEGDVIIAKAGTFLRAGDEIKPVIVSYKTVRGVL